MKFLLLMLLVTVVGTGRVKRVVGGRKTKAHKYPWLVFLETLDGRGEEGRCGGTIIHPRHILTAAHCLMDSCGNIVRKVKVHLGAQDVCEEDWSGTHLVRPARFIFHPGYNPQTDENDIAILRLKRDIRFGAKTSPQVWMISLPPLEAAADCQLETEFDDLVERAREACQDQQEEESEEYEYYYEEDEEDYYDDQYSEDSEDSDNIPPVFQSDFREPSDWSDEVEYDYQFSDNCTTYYDGHWATIAGWGATYKFDGSCILRHARKKIFPNHHTICLDESDYVMERDKICAYNPHWNSDACQGDSGSPLVVFTDTGPVLVGIVSYGWECGDERSPGVYSRVQFFRHWILQTIMSD